MPFRALQSSFGFGASDLGFGAGNLPCGSEPVRPKRACHINMISLPTLASSCLGIAELPCYIHGERGLGFRRTP